MNEFLWLFTRASKLMRGAADEAMSKHGVRVGQNMLLEILWETDGLTPGELAGRLQIATPTVVKSVNRMAVTGLLARRPDPADARLVRVYLTEHGRAVRGAIERERNDLELRATRTLTEAEHSAVLSALRKMIAQFDGTEAPPPSAPG